MSAARTRHCGVHNSYLRTCRDMFEDLTDSKNIPNNVSAIRCCNGHGFKNKRGQTNNFVLPSFLNAAATYSPTCAVPSARSGLTSLFGMGRGGALTLLPPDYLFRVFPVFLSTLFNISKKEKNFSSSPSFPSREYHPCPTQKCRVISIARLCHY